MARVTKRKKSEKDKKRSGRPGFKDDSKRPGDRASSGVQRKQITVQQSIGGRKVTPEQAAKVKKTGFLAAAPKAAPKKKKGGGGGTSAPTGGFTDISNIKESDVLPEFREQLGFKPAFGGGSFGAGAGGSFENKPGVLQGISDALSGAWESATAETLGQQFKPEGPVIPLDMLIFGSLGLTSNLASTTLKGAVGTTAPTVGKLTPPAASTAIHSNIFGQMATNTKTSKVTMSYFAKLVKATKHPLVVLGMLGTAVGSYPWTGHLRIDTVAVGYSMAARDARQAGFFDLADEIDEALDEFLYPPLWERIVNNAPLANLIKVTMFDGIKQAKISAAAYKQITTEMIYQRDNNLTENDMWDIRNANKAAADKAYTDYINAESIKSEKEKIRLRKEASEASDKRDRKALLDELKLREEYDKKRIERAKEADEESNKLWLEYKRILFEMELEQAETLRNAWNANAPSALNFGLL